ncbi:NADH-quinone oxidoreductase subunit NuoN [Actinomyces vulturis]|uniref:NADH-quinone oxidoreductase subunit NuoN n=1 Tax=Actinomyces vulturis TaxID=1857645 RepID=UPI000835B747|nr:NADH-quinone oxidoreductase subunit NuoN [Actinomyces vulturis]
MLLVLGAGVVGVLIESFVSRRYRSKAQMLVSFLGLLAALVALASRWSVLTQDSGNGEVFGVRIAGGFIEDPFGVLGQFIIVCITLLALLVMGDHTSAADGAFAAQSADRPGSAEETESLRAGFFTTEIYPLTLFSAGGMMLFPMVDNLIALFVVLEIISLPLYIMAATARHRRMLSQEAALKYFVLGAFASGFLLMGSAFLYGFSGSVEYATIYKVIVNPMGLESFQWLLVVGMVMVTVGLLFKIAAVPFHAWSPDVYQGAPTPITGFMAAGVKAAAFLALLRFYGVVVFINTDTIHWFMWGVAILTMLTGTVVGLVQRDIKRMLAYSAIAHAGFMLIGVIAFNELSIEGILFYALVYGVATVGAFGIITLVRENHEGAPGAEATSIDAYRGLGKTNPFLATCMMIFLLSFAGVPLTAGFIGKFEVFSAGVAGGAWELVVLAIICSAATAFFYMRLLVLMFFSEPVEGNRLVVESTGATSAAIAIAAAATIILGVVPQPFIELGRLAVMLVG